MIKFEKIIQEEIEQEAVKFAKEYLKTKEGLKCIERAVHYEIKSIMQDNPLDGFLRKEITDSIYDAIEDAILKRFKLARKKKE